MTIRRVAQVVHPVLLPRMQYVNMTLNTSERHRATLSVSWKGLKEEYWGEKSQDIGSEELTERHFNILQAEVIETDHANKDEGKREHRRTRRCFEIHEREVVEE